MSASSESNHARLSAPDRRQQLIEVAIDVFSKRGFSGTTTKEIAAAAGVTEAIIFRHFANKQQLYQAILDQKFSPDQTAVWRTEMMDYVERRDDEGLFRAIITKIIEMHRTDVRYERVMLFAALEGNELATTHLQRTAQPIIDHLCDYIALRQREGAIRKMDPRAIFFAAISLAKQFAFLKYMCPSGENRMLEDDAIESFVQILMNGIREPIRETWSSK